MNAYTKSFLNNFRCPKCHSSLKEEANTLVCSSCNQQYRIVNGIPDFREKDEYWCNVSREKMQELNKLARDSGDWLGAAKKVVPQYLDHFVSFSRADQQFLWPTTKESIILDAGSMWGGITIPVAQYHREVYAVDKTLETLEFLNIRAEQMNFHNIHTVAASLRKLPFPDNFFDLVVLNGVLEWVALDEDVVLEKQWQGIGRGFRFGRNKKYAENPTQMQLRVLQEINRVLKPGGSLYLAIENRIGYIYLVGWPEPHMNLPFTCFLPRFLTNTITRLFLKCEYRTYVYTIPGYRSLLKRSRFSSQVFYGAFHDYRKPTEVIPLELISSLKKKIFANKRWQLKLVSKLIPGEIMKYLPPSIICLASKNSRPNYEPRIKQIFQKAKLISGDCSNFKAVKWESRVGNDLPVNYLIYTDSSRIPAYFCKICRDKRAGDILKNEARNLESINSLLKNKKLGLSIPQLIYYGTVDEITILVTKYLFGNPIKSSLWDKLKRLSFRSDFIKRFFPLLNKHRKIFPLLNKYATKKWLGEVDPVIYKAVLFLNDFQRVSTVEKVNAASYLNAHTAEQIDRISKNKMLDDKIFRLIKELHRKIRLLNGVSLPLCLEHGDYNLGNILMLKDKINIVDFEHSEQIGLPFFDLGNLLFSPLLAQWKEIGHEIKLKEFADAYGWSTKLCKWIKYYSEISGISMKILIFLPSLVALEQNARGYPIYRNPYTYPMYGKDILEEMLQWNL